MLNQMLSIINREDLTEEITSFEDNRNDLPWYVGFFTGFSAWIASFFLVVAYFALVKDVNVSAGIIFLIIAVAIDRAGKERIFLSQFSLALGIAAQAITIIAIQDMTKSASSTAAISIFIFGIVVVAIQNPVSRFLAVSGIFFSLIFMIYDNEVFFVLHFLQAALGIMTLAVILNEIKLIQMLGRKVVKPVTYAIVLCTGALPFLTLSGSVWKTTIQYWWISTMLMCIITLFALPVVFKDLKIKLSDKSFILSASLVILFSAVSFNSPGLITAVFLIVLGFHFGKKFVFYGSIGLMIAYLIKFYYFMNITLLQKSLVLMASGIILLTAYYVFSRFNPAPEGDLQ